MDTAQRSLVRTPFDDPDFLFELKHDGFRALAHVWDGKCELVSRRRNAYKSFQDLRDNLTKLKVQNAVIDGEIACLDSEGRSIFNELLFRRGCPIFCAFDILYLNDHDLRQLPLLERKEKLRAVIEKSQLPDVLCGKYIEARGVDLFKNPLYTQSERRRELFDSFAAQQRKRELPPLPKKPLPPIPKKPPLRAIPVSRKAAAKSRRRSAAD